MSTTHTPQPAPLPRTCSDCGRRADGLTTAFDPISRSEVTLCPSCTVAFQQRRHFTSGCCD